MPNIDAQTRDSSSPVWDMSQERAFMEKLVNQRLNFFLVFFTVVIAGAANARADWHLGAILGLGTLICWLLAATIFRARVKWNLLMQELYKDPSHPATIINGLAKGRSVRNVLGFWIPTICSVLLSIGFGLFLLGVVKSEPTQQSRWNSEMEELTQRQSLSIDEDRARIDSLDRQVRDLLRELESSNSTTKRPVLQ